MLRSIAAQYDALRGWRASCSAFGPAVGSRTAALLRARWPLAKRRAPGGALDLGRRALSWMRPYRAAIAEGARRAVHARRLAGKPVAAARRRAEAARRFLQRGPAKARMAWLAVIGIAASLCGKFAHNALSWTQHRRGAIVRRARLTSVTRRLAGAIVAATKPRLQAAWRVVRRGMIKARMEWIAGITAAVGVALCGMFYWMSWGRAYGRDFGGFSARPNNCSRRVISAQTVAGSMPSANHSTTR